MPINEKIRLLLIEDEKDFSTVLAGYLTQKGFVVGCAFTAARALKKLSRKPDLIILDLGLPDKEGCVLLGQIRQKTSAPLLVLSARDSVEDKVKALDAGADDYLVKPASLAELVLRLKRLLDRKTRPGLHSAVFNLGKLKFDTVSGLLSAGDKTAPLTKRERDVLAFLVVRRGQVLSRLEIIEHVWGDELDPFSNTVGMVVSSLRKKLKILSDKEFIQTVHGVGYRFS